MQEFEYKVTFIQPADMRSLETVLNNYAKEGWAYCDRIPPTIDGGVLVIIMDRAVEPNADVPWGFPS